MIAADLDIIENTKDNIVETFNAEGVEVEAEIETLKTQAERIDQKENITSTTVWGIITAVMIDIDIKITNVVINQDQDRHHAIVTEVDKDDCSKLQGKCSQSYSTLMSFIFSTILINYFE